MRVGRGYKTRHDLLITCHGLKWMCIVVLIFTSNKSSCKAEMIKHIKGKRSKVGKKKHWDLPDKFGQMEGRTNTTKTDAIKEYVLQSQQKQEAVEDHDWPYSEETQSRLCKLLLISLSIEHLEKLFIFMSVNCWYQHKNNYIVACKSISPIFLPHKMAQETSGSYIWTGWAALM